MTILRGFPTEISEEIQLPDIAELLRMPSFFDNSPEDVYKHGTDFQRKLLDMTPLRNTKKTVSVLSQVRLLSPSFRSCTGITKATQSFVDEWHIDCEEFENEGGRHHYAEPKDIVHLLSNDVSCLTEFNLNEYKVDWDGDRPLHEFIDFVFNNGLVEAKTMPANRIVTFENHLHRAIDPKRIEFRFMWRVVETDRDRPVAKYYPNNPVTISGLEGVETHSYQTDKSVIINLPKTLQTNSPTKPVYPYRTEQQKIADFIEFQNNFKFNSINLSSASWEGRDITANKGFIKNSVVIYALTQMTGKEAKEAFEHYEMSLEVEKIQTIIRDLDVPGDSFNLTPSEIFLVDDLSSQYQVIGVVIPFGVEYEHLNPEHRYTVEFINNKTFGVTTDSNIVFITGVM